MAGPLEFAFIPVGMAVPRRNGALTPFVVPGGDRWKLLGEQNAGRHNRGDGVLWLNPAWSAGMSCKYIRSVNVDNLGGMAVYDHIHHEYPSVVIRPVPMLNPVLNYEAIIKERSMQVEIGVWLLSGREVFRKHLPGLPILTIKQLGIKVLEHMCQHGGASCNSKLIFVEAGGTQRLSSGARAWTWPRAGRRAVSSSSSTPKVNTIKNYMKHK